MVLKSVTDQAAGCIRKSRVAFLMLSFVFTWSQFKVKKSRTFSGTPSQSHNLSLAIWDHHGCHPTQMSTPCLNPIQRPVLDLPTPEGWKADLT